VPVAVSIGSGVLVSVVAIAIVAVVAVSRLAELDAGQHRLNRDAVAPATALDEVRRAFLQTRVDAFADEWVAETNGVEHEAFLKDGTTMDEAVGHLAAVVGPASRTWSLSSEQPGRTTEQSSPATST
jgi:methyl-accepting chemotaxis protein